MTAELGKAEGGGQVQPERHLAVVTRSLNTKWASDAPEPALKNLIVLTSSQPQVQRLHTHSLKLAMRRGLKRQISANATN